MSQQICGICRLPIHESETGIRHFGRYVAHSQYRCVELLRSLIADLTRERDDLKSLILIDADCAGYYGENPDSAMQCWRDALSHTRDEIRELVKERDKALSAATESNERAERAIEVSLRPHTHPVSAVGALAGGQTERECGVRLERRP